jgi:hypothetical protein
MMYSCAPLAIASSIDDISVSVVQNTTDAKWLDG